MIKSRQYNLLLLVAKLTPPLLLLFLITAVIHEGAHFVSALILGIPIAYFNWFDLNYFAPVIVPSSIENTFGMQIVSYAGGIVTGTLLLGVLILKRDWFKQSLYKWFLGFSIAAFGFWELSQGILEGAFHDRYISDVANMFSSSYLIGYAFAFVGMIVYSLSMRGFNQLVTKEMLNCTTGLKHT